MTDTTRDGGLTDPRHAHHEDGFPAQSQDQPGLTEKTTPEPDHGEQSYVGHGRLEGRRALITGGDSGIGRAVAIAFAREGADVLIAYLDEITDQEWDYTSRLNVGAYFHLVKSALPHMGAGASIIGSSSVNSDMPNPKLAPYAATKAAIANFLAGLAEMLGEKGIRANSVAPGPIWTPLIPSTMPPEKVKQFGESTPLGRAGQPVEPAPVYVMLASDEARYVTGTRIAVTGGRPILRGLER